MAFINKNSRMLALLASLLPMPYVFAETPAEVKTEYGDYKDWRVLGVSHRLEKKYMRANIEE